MPLATATLPPKYGLSTAPTGFSGFSTTQSLPGTGGSSGSPSSGPRLVKQVSLQAAWNTSFKVAPPLHTAGHTCAAPLGPAR